MKRSQVRCSIILVLLLALVGGGCRVVDLELKSKEINLGKDPEVKPLIDQLRL